VGAEVATARAAVDELRRQRAEAELDQGRAPALRRAQEELRNREAAQLKAMQDHLAASLVELIEQERELSRAEQAQRAEALRLLRRESMRAELERHPIRRLYGPGVSPRTALSPRWACGRPGADVGEGTAEKPSGPG